MRTLVRFLAVGAAVAIFSSCFAEKWCFIVAGDGRSDSSKSRAMDHNGVNVTITKECEEAVLREHAKFVAWTGDLVHGYTNEKEFESQLHTWRDIMQPLYDQGIPVLPCRGNHDQSSASSQAVWNRVFSGTYALPKNGPNDEKGLTWFFEMKDVLFVGLDQYTKGYEEIDQPWLDQVLLRHKHPFIFAMGHEPAFNDGAHDDTMDSHPTQRDIFWENLMAAGGRVFFCGHDHLYDHMKVVRAGSHPGVEMQQFVAGTSGAPFYPKGDYKGTNTVWKTERVKNITNTYGYMLVTIDGDTCTIEFKGRTAPGVYVTMDFYSFKKT